MMLGIISIENINYNIPFETFLLSVDNDDLEAGNNEDQDDIATEPAVKIVFAEEDEHEDENIGMAVTPAEDDKVTGDQDLMTKDTVQISTQTQTEIGRAHV